jgi:type VI secretion system protein ImpK
MSDQTVIVPTPGGQRNTPLPAGNSGAAEVPSFNTKVDVQTAINPVVLAATNLLNVVVKLKTEINLQDVQDLHRKLGQELQSFDQTLRQKNIDEEQIIRARYLLCTVIDETALNTPWGRNSPWSSHSLLSIFHKETFGGERCFTVLQKLLENPGRNLDLLELNYICLSLGFEGKFRVEQRGFEQLEIIRDNLFHTIEKHKPEFNADLSDKWKGLNTKEKSLTQYIPLWVILSFALLILVTIYIGFRVWIYNDTQPTTDLINNELTENVIELQNKTDQ